MATFDVAFYSFDKKSNSTKRPEPESGEFYSGCRAIYPMNVLHPRITIQTENPSSWNYAYITQLGRYYYVREWTYEAGLWAASLDVDALASWKEYIGDADLYVLRASNESDGTIQDNLYPMEVDPNRVATTAESPWAESFANGWFVVGIVGPNGGATGVSYYVMTPTQFLSFNSYLFANIDWLSLDPNEIGEGLAKSLINPYQYIVSCKWFPCEPPVSTTEENIKYGWWSVPCDCRRLNALASTMFNVVLTKEQHPQMSDRGMFVNAAPYTELAIEMPPFGRIDLNATAYCDVDSVFVQTDVDFISGSGILRIYAGNSGGSGAVCTNRLEANMAIDVPISQLSVDAQGAINSIAGAVNGIGSLNFLGSAASIGSAITSMAFPTLQTTGGMSGNLAVYGHAPKLHHTFWRLPEDDNDHRGRPLMKNRTPTSLGGYILAADGDISAPATAIELQSIKGTLETGFFYE